MKIFEFNGLRLEYDSIGNGHDVILCFHGFGRSSEDFRMFGSLLSPNHKIIAVNLFAHQNSYFPSERIDKHPLTKTEWKEVILAFTKHLSIESFHLVGYSMGGRISLVTLELIPNMIKSVLLIAPDGLKVNLLYRFASNTRLGRSLYRSIIQNPGWLFRIAWLLNKLGLLSNKLHRFVHVHLDTKEKRWLVHDAWLIYKEMFPELPKVSRIISEKKETFNMIFGEFDTVITVKLGRRFSSLIGSNRHLHILLAGHKLLNDQTLDYIRTKKLWPI